MEQISYRVKGFFFLRIMRKVYLFSRSHMQLQDFDVSVAVCKQKKIKKRPKKAAGVITLITITAYKAEGSKSVGIQRIECGL